MSNKNKSPQPPESQKIQLEYPPKLQNDINEIKLEIADLKKNYQPKESPKYVSRNYVADEIIGCDISTVHNLTVRGVLTKYQIGGKVLYRLDEVLDAIVKLKK